jgi:hypothetical protein
VAAKIHENETLIYFPTKGSACVYVLRCGEEIVYIGASGFVYRRLTFHRGKKQFDSVGIIHCENRKAALALESKLIARHQPSLNISKSYKVESSTESIAGSDSCLDTLPALLRFKRHALGLTVRSVAAATGISKSKINRFERDASSITLWEYEQLARVFNLDILIVT